MKTAENRFGLNPTVKKETKIQTRASTISQPDPVVPNKKEPVVPKVPKENLQVRTVVQVKTMANTSMPMTEKSTQTGLILTKKTVKFYMIN
jgi:hypothetical protein